MFKLGDRVRNPARNVVGAVIDIDGDTVYIEQDNGCEVDFPATTLVLEKDFQARHDTSLRADAAASRSDPVYAAVLANIYPAVLQLGQAEHAAAERIPGVTPKTWDELSALQKLNAVSAATEVPIKAWIDANQPGAKPNIGALQLSILGALKKKTPST
jgi:hypothetical protein